MKQLEEITYEVGRHALADQEAIVAGIRQRTGTLLAAHALVASFLGAAAIRKAGLTGGAWFALAALLIGLVVAAVLLGPWRLTFSFDARHIYDEARVGVTAEAATDTSAWLAAVGFGYQALRERNTVRVRWMSHLAGVLGVLMVAQTVGWILELVG